jgi:hypothetical protein
MRLEPMLTAKQVAALYGVSVMAVWRCADRRAIRSYRLAEKAVRFRRSELPDELPGARR